jgi:signal transduction histidine kinase
LDATFGPLERVGILVSRRAWTVVILGSVLLAGIYLVLPDGQPAQAVFHDAVGLVAAALLAVRLVREGLVRSRPWVYLLTAVVLYAVVSPFWGTIPVLTGRELPYPSWVDAAYFVSYASAAAFLVSLIHRRHRDLPGIRHSGFVALTDALILGIAITALLWPTQRALLPAEIDLSAADQAVAVGYLVLTAALVGLALRLITSDLRRSTVHWLLLVWVGGELAGDLFYGALAAGDSFYYGHPIGALWIASYVGLGVLALHPRLRDLTTGQAEMRLTGWRVWLRFIAVLAPFVVLVVRPSTLVAWLAAAALALGLVRLRVLMSDLATQQDVHRELRQAITDLERANQQLNHFASIASHDLRAPLANTHGLLETLVLRGRTPLATRDRELLERALANTAGLLQNLEALLTLARTQNASVTRRPVDLDALVDEVALLLADDLNDAGATIRRDRLPTIPADYGLARILLQNLLANAAKYRHPDRALEVSVSASQVNGRWEIAVADNGRGIDPADRERIFDLFARAEDGTRVAGAGIGLATCKRIAERHGGTIRAEPLTLGTRFVVTLPAGGDDPDPAGS